MRLPGQVLDRLKVGPTVGHAERQPCSMLKYDTEMGGYVVVSDRAQLETAPYCEAGTLPRGETRISKPEFMVMTTPSGARARLVSGREPRCACRIRRNIVGQ